MATGVFDLLHVGHLHYLHQARELGDELVVIIARDTRVRGMKREPIVPEEQRRELVEALKPVDRALLGDEDDIYKSVERVRPDVIALGWDQPFDAEEIEAECRRRGAPAKVVRLEKMEGDLQGTTKLVNRIVRLWPFPQQAEGSPGEGSG